MKVIDVKFHDCRSFHELDPDLFSDEGLGVYDTHFMKIADSLKTGRGDIDYIDEHKRDYILWTYFDGVWIEESDFFFKDYKQYLRKKFMITYIEPWTEQ